jgi:hypothetical protein
MREESEEITKKERVKGERLCREKSEKGKREK